MDHKTVKSALLGPSSGKASLRNQRNYIEIPKQRRGSLDAKIELRRGTVDAKIDKVEFIKCHEETNPTTSGDVRFERACDKSKNVRFVKAQNVKLESVNFAKFEGSSKQNYLRFEDSTKQSYVKEANTKEGRIEKVEYVKFQDDASDDDEDVRFMGGVQDLDEFLIKMMFLVEN